MKALFIEPMLCVPTSELLSGPESSYELKLDGYRGLAIKAGGRCKLLSTQWQRPERRFPEITGALQHLPDDTVIDGEIVALDTQTTGVIQSSRELAWPRETALKPERRNLTLGGHLRFNDLSPIDRK